MKKKKIKKGKIEVELEKKWKMLRLKSKRAEKHYF